MTRTADEGLYQEGDANKKITDLQARCRIINDSDADITISIHQNSFTSESSHGAQVFYQASSETGKSLAETLQSQLISSLDQENNRVAKANSDYYMLKNTQGTMVIVECGFLSNSQEAELLTQESYQRRVAWAIALGALQYLGDMGE
jgi:N-acetylmuramoyl-L-alanine amidase